MRNLIIVELGDDFGFVNSLIQNVKFVLFNSKHDHLLIYNVNDSEIFA